MKLVFILLFIVALDSFFFQFYMLVIIWFDFMSYGLQILKYSCKFRK